MKLKKIIVVLICMIITSLSYAQTVSEQNAHKAAYNFGMQHPQSLSLVYQKEKDNNILYRVYSNSFGFIIISADYRCTPILAYSREGAFLLGTDHEPLYESFWAWMKTYEDQILYVIQHNLPADDKITSAWGNLLDPKLPELNSPLASLDAGMLFAPTGSSMTTSSITAVSPLLTTKWGQI